MPALEISKTIRERRHDIAHVVLLAPFSIFSSGRQSRPAFAEGNAMIGNLVRVVTTCVIVLGLGSSAAMAQTGYSSGRNLPVPANIEAPDGYSVFFKAHAVGTQNYVCLPAATGVAWKFVAPQATLFQTFLGAVSQQVATHFLGVNPSESGVLRPTWQHSFDSSRVWARMLRSSTDSNFVQPGAIPWLLLTVVGADEGPEGGAFLTRAEYIHRVNTGGGVMPPTGCSQSAEVGAIALVPYEADYLFYKAQPRH